jgi:hypothetical protein
MNEMQTDPVELLKMVKIDDLKRYGRANDGGYVCSQKFVQESDCLLSFGINDDWSFEKNFVGNVRCTCYAFDFSIRRNSLIKRSGTQLKYFFGDLVKRRPVQFGRLGKSISDAIKFLDFNIFFRIHKFYAFGLDKENAGVFLDFSTIIQQYLPEKKNIFLKVDIEGMEYDVMDDILEFEERIGSMVLEVHHIHSRFAAFQTLMHSLQKYYHIYHIHENNYSDMTSTSGFPDAIELSLVRKDIAGPVPYYPDLSHLPLKNLDMLNNPLGSLFQWQK